MLRAAATVSLLAGVAVFVAYLHVVGKSPFSSLQDRHLRAMKDRLDPPESLTPYTFDDFVALPHGRPVAEYSALERRGVSLEGYVQSMFRSADGDVHLEILPEVLPDRYRRALGITGEITPQWLRGSETWRWERLVAAFRPHSWPTPSFPGGPRRARVSGWLLYDFQYDAPHAPVRAPLVPGPRGGRRLTGWEIHPVTRIELWDDSLQAYVELPR